MLRQIMITFTATKIIIVIINIIKIQQNKYIIYNGVIDISQVLMIILLYYNYINDNFVLFF